MKKSLSLFIFLSLSLLSLHGADSDFDDDFTLLDEYGNEIEEPAPAANTDETNMSFVNVDPETDDYKETAAAFDPSSYVSVEEEDPFTGVLQASSDLKKHQKDILIHLLQIRKILATNKSSLSDTQFFDTFDQTNTAKEQLTQYAIEKLLNHNHKALIEELGFIDRDTLLETNFEGPTWKDHTKHDLLMWLKDPLSFEIFKNYIAAKTDPDPAHQFVYLTNDFFEQLAKQTPDIYDLDENGELIRVEKK